MSTELHSERGFFKIIQGGAADWQNYVEIKKVKTGVTVYPGRIVSGAGETEGEIDLAADGDGAAAGAYIVLKRANSIPQDIDTGISAGQFCEVLRQSGGRFVVAALMADQSADTELDELLCLEADGMLQKWAYTDTAAGTDTLVEAGGGIWRCAEVVVDEAAHDKVQCIYW